MECGIHFFSIAEMFLQIDFWEEWPSGLKRCDRIGRFPTQTQNSPETKLVPYTNELCIENVWKRS